MKKIGSTILFLFKDSDGFGSGLVDALRPSNPNSASLQTLEDSLELSLDRYGIKDHTARGSLLHFVDSNGDFQASVLLMEKYEPPILACALNEVLSLVIREASSSLPSLIVPFIGAGRLKWGKTASTANSSQWSLYSVQIGPETDLTRAIVTKTQRAPSSLQILYEPLACFLQLVRVLNLPTSVLIGQRGRSISDNSSGEEALEIIYEVGEILSKTTCLHFSKEKLTWNPVKMKDTEEPWRALYG